MSQPVRPIPKRSRPLWDPRLEPLELGDAPGAEIPLLGTVSAGRPLEVPEEDRETVRVPHRLARKASYALRVRGQSMTDEGIEDGDIVVLERRPTAENGETVVALVDGTRATLKRFYRDAEGIRLQPANPEMEPIRLRDEAIEILGVVSGVVRLSP